MKNRLINFLTWALCKLDQTKLESLKIESKEIKLKLSKLVPDDGNWHEVGATILLVCKGGKKHIFDEVSVFNKVFVNEEINKVQNLRYYWNLSETNDRTP